METQMVNVREGTLVVCRIPGDGNCLFSSLAHQIWQSLPATELNNFHARSLRALVVEYYRSKAGELEEQLTAQDQVIFQQPNSSNTTCNLATPGFWGGEESIRAVAAIFEYNIRVYSENASMTTIGEPGARNQQDLSIVHRSNEYGAYNHYDSVIRLIENDEPPRVKRRHNPTPGFTPSTQNPFPIHHLLTERRGPTATDTHEVTQHSDI
ncbi:deubiquitinase OTUD6B-like [Wyeomyia smithii]|uniref:deubiquitinase OTUD6B-like n=1 Tax=Wyeomyia smithii TaxID=174621 RepID=UPI002467ADD4|nr:deubiquitinase OTUD6B-like [Wyeomyia smithii]